MNKPNWEIDLDDIFEDMNSYTGAKLAEDELYDRVVIFIRSTIKQAQEEILSKVVLEWEPAHTYSSENADVYRAYDAGFQKAMRDLNTLNEKLKESL